MLKICFYNKDTLLRALIIYALLNCTVTTLLILKHQLIQGLFIHIATVILTISIVYALFITEVLILDGLYELYIKRRPNVRLNRNKI